MAADGGWDLERGYRLLDAADRQRWLDRVTARLAGLASPVQVWHGPSAPDPGPPGGGAAAALARDLAAAARPRVTVVGPPTPVAPPVRPHLERSRHLVRPDGTLVRLLAVSRLPATVEPGWTDAVAARCETVVAHLRPLPQDLAARILRRRLASLTSSVAVDVDAGRLPDEGLALSAETARALGGAVAAGTTRLMHLQLLLAVSAADPAGLRAGTVEVLDLLAAQLAEGRVLTFEQAPAWRSSLPGGPPLRSPWRLLDAASAAACLPHPVGPPPQGPGILLGREPRSGVPLVSDRFAAHNPTRLVVGTSGAGKSYAAKLEVMRQRVAGTRLVVVDPEGEFGGVADALGGLTLAVGDEPVGLDPVGLACREGLAPSEGLAVLATWAAALLAESLSPVDLALLDWSLSVLRADTTRTARTAGDLLAVVTDIAAHPPFLGATLPARLVPAAHGTLAGLFAPNPELADPPGLVVFDLRAVPGRVRPAVMACVLAWAWAEASGEPGVRRLVVVDEAHLLLDDPQAADLLSQFARRSRKYGMALDVVTQRLSDFVGHPAGEAVLANAATKLVLACEDRERAAVVAGLGLSGPEAECLRPGERGRGLLLSPGLRTPVEVVAGPAEHVLACGGPR